MAEQRDAINELLIIDPTVENIDRLLQGKRENIALLPLSRTVSVFKQIANYLERTPGFSRLHILSHGEPGALLFQGEKIDRTTLDEQRADLQRISRILGSNAKVLLYGCSVAADLAGRQFVDRLQSVLNIPVAASSGPVGSTALGGAWLLRSDEGVETRLAFDSAARANYPSLLATSTLTAGSEAPSLSTGDDTVTVNVTNSLNAGDTIDGQAGTDALEISAAQTVTLGATTLTNFETITITAGSQDITTNDATVGSGLSLTVNGSADTSNIKWDGSAETDGAFSIIGGSGRDTLIGGAGNDTISSGDANDTVSANAGEDIIDGGNGNDTVYGGDGNDTLSGAAGNDFLYGADGNDWLYGNDGNDGLSGGNGDDSIWGGAGNDTLMGANGNDVLSGGDGNDWIWGQNNDDTLYGGLGNDTLSGDNGNDVIYGEDGDDTLSGGTGDDTIYGGSGNDVLSGQSGADFLYGGDGNDTFAGTTSFLDGDTIGDFTSVDSIKITGTDLSSLNGTAAGSTLDLGGGKTLSFTGLGAGTWVATYTTFTTITFVASSGSDDSSSGSTNTTSNVDGVTVTGTTGNTTTSWTDPVTGTQRTALTQTVTTTIPIVTASRDEEDFTTTQADIPLAQNANGETVLQVSLPVGAGLTTEAVSGTGSGGPTLRDLLIDASVSRVDQPSFTNILGDGIDNFVSGVQDEGQVTLRTITFQSDQSSGAGLSEPIVISGASGTGESDPNNPNRQEAVVIDTGNLPTGTVLQLNNVEFAIIIGASRVTGGSGQNLAVGDDAVQFIVLGEDDDVLHGGGGNDTVGSKGGDDRLYGDDGDDLVVGGEGNDMLYGGSGNDVLQGGQSDAGTWQFSLGSDGQLHSHLEVLDSDLADGLSFDSTGSWVDSNGQATANDARVAFTAYSPDSLETIALLYRAVMQSLPDVNAMSYWAGRDLDPGQYAEQFYAAYQARHLDLQNQPLETRVADLIEQVWGADAVSDEWIAAGVDFINNGGTWAEGLNFLARHTNATSSLFNYRGAMALTLDYQAPQLGWSPDTGNDELYGGEGDDTLVGGRGQNILDGGEGRDTAMVVGNSSDYRFQVDTDGRLVMESLNGSDSDVLIGVENAVFGDGSQNVSASNLDADTMLSAVGLFRLENGALPTMSQLNQVAADGVNINELAQQIYDGDTAQSRWGNLSNGEFVSELTREVLGTALSGEMHTYWTSQLANSFTLTRAEAFIIAIGTPEFQADLFGNGALTIAV